MFEYFPPSSEELNRHNTPVHVAYHPETQHGAIRKIVLDSLKVHKEAELERATRYEGEIGKTALELLNERANVTTQDTDWGKMVIGINDVLADNKNNFWAFLVDGEMAPEGAETYQTKNNQLIEWELQQIQTDYSG